MFTNTFPVFDKGRVLKKEMLDNLRDYPRNFIDICFKDYSNGIIAGADLVIDQKDITINNGIIKYNGKMYMLEEEIRLPYYSTNKEVVIKIKFFDEISQRDFKINRSEVFIDQNVTLEKDEMELGRFKLREGAILRTNYTDFYDFSTEFNTINIINVEYSAYKKSTLSISLLKYFSKIIFKYNSRNPLDIAFAMQCMDEKVIDRELIQYYVCNRLNMDYKECTNAQIYKYLCQIVKDVESGGSRRTEAKQNRPARIIVD